LWALASRHTPLKQGVNESRWEPAQKVRYAQFQTAPLLFIASLGQSSIIGSNKI
jgi:hypothetical protein